MKNICFCPKCMNTFETPGIVGERIYNCSNDDAYPGDPVCPVCGSADYFEGDDAVAEMAAIIESYVKTRNPHWRPRPTDKLSPSLRQIAEQAAQAGEGGQDASRLD